MENLELNKIKKIYGENFAKLCRKLFPTILEKEGLLTYILTTKFAPSHNLYDTIINSNSVEKFQQYICSFVLNNKDVNFNTTKTPEELLDEANYILYPECKTEDDIQKFKKYYANGEELCTFNGYRLETCRVWFAVKKNVNTIKREDFKNPQRQDAYGTSVISIQFTKGDINYLSIKNRYNHIVKNPDATFENDLDCIMPGLNSAFVKVYGLNLGVDELQSELDFGCFRLGTDGKYYIYNSKFLTKTYCDNNVILDVYNRPHLLDKSTCLVFDHYIVNFQTNIIYTDDINDSFIDSIGKIKNISIKKIDNNIKQINITPISGENVIISLNSRNQIIEYINKNVTEIGNYFLSENTTIKSISLPKVEKVGNCFLMSNKDLTEINMPELTTCKNMFLLLNDNIKYINFPKLSSAGFKFLDNVRNLTNAIFPNLQSAGSSFLSRCTDLVEFHAPLLEHVEDYFLQTCLNLTILDTPNLIDVYSSFLEHNNKITTLYLPNLEKVGYNFLYMNECLTNIYAPRLIGVGDNFLRENNSLTEIELPNLRVVRDNFLCSNSQLETIYLPSILRVGQKFLHKVPKKSFIKELIK